MRQMSKVEKRQLLGLILALVVSFLCTAEVAYAGESGGIRRGCFASDIPVLTPAGYTPINQLSQGSQVISYNLSNHQPEIGTVITIQEGTTADYYVINNAINVTGTSLVYVLDSDEKIKQIQVRDLNLGDQLIGEESNLRISHLQHGREPIAVYNLILISPNDSFYAGGFLVYNKHCTYAIPKRIDYSYPEIRRTGSLSKPLPSFRIVLIVLVGLIPGIFFREIYNFIGLRNKEFTERDDLIEHTQAVSPAFTNRYSIQQYSPIPELFYPDEWASVPFRIWNQVPLALAIDPHRYQHLLSKQELFENTCRLFIRYQQDWMTKDVAAMQQYVAKSLYTHRHSFFQSKYGESVDVIYNPEVSGVALLDFTEGQDQYFFGMQINAKMTNFVVSSRGYVIQGKPEPRSLTEYWTLRLDSDKNWWLINIDLIYVSRYLSVQGKLI